MALLRKFEERHKTTPSVHDEVDCSYAIFEIDGASYLQLDTYGSPESQNPDAVKQIIQIDADSARELQRLIGRAFPELR